MDDLSGASLGQFSLTLIDDCVVATIQSDFHDEVFRRFSENVLAKIEQTRAGALLLDLSNVYVLDPRDFESIRKIMRMTGLMGARSILVGLRPGVAASLAELNADLTGVTAMGSVEQALQAIRGR